VLPFLRLPRHDLAGVVIFNFRRRRNSDEVREERNQAIRELGYTLVKGGMSRDGRRIHRGYTLLTSDGEILDNMGMGFSSSYEALAAAERDRALRKPPGDLAS
jgi:hypothetical protein